MEIFKDIPGFEGLYEVSNLGRIKALDTWRSGRNGSKRFIKEHFLKPYYDGSHYVRVRLWKNENPMMMKIHRAIALAFIPNPKNLPQVNHINGNPLDNRIENLEWVTLQQNIKHAYAIGLNKPRKGADHHGARRIIQMTLSGEVVGEFETVRAASRHIGVNESAIIGCAKGRVKTCIGFKWQYA